MKWIAISGSWRTVDTQVERDVRLDVASIIERGDGIVTGGALGVDYIATDEVLGRVIDDSKIRIVLPTPLDIYSVHFRNRASEGVISSDQAEALVFQLERVRGLGESSLSEMGFTTVDKDSYYARNSAVLGGAEELYAYHVNGTAGVQDAIDKARESGKPVTVREYKIDTQ